MASQLQDFPPEILIYILSHMPTQNILRCESVCKTFRDVIAGSPRLQYNMELEIAGLVDRPSVRLPVAKRLESLKIHQQRIKDPGSRVDRPIVRYPRKPDSGPTKLISDLFFTPYITVPGDAFDSIDIGHIRPVGIDEGDAIQWWTIHPPNPFDTLYADPCQDMLTLLDRRSPGFLQVVSITSGKSLIDDDLLEVPVPGSAQQWVVTDVQIYGDLIAHVFMILPEGCGITIVGWRDGAVRVCSRFLEGVGSTISFVSETKFLASAYGKRESGLQMYAFQGLAEEGFPTLNHMATFLFPSSFAIR